MRLVTWNVNSIRARAERVGAWIDRQQPDVLCLQETRCSDEDFPRDLFEDRGYAVEIFGQPGRNGVCIAAREGLEAGAAVGAAPALQHRRGVRWARAQPHREQTPAGAEVHLQCRRKF